MSRFIQSDWCPQEIRLCSDKIRNVTLSKGRDIWSFQFKTMVIHTRRACRGCSILYISSPLHVAICMKRRDEVVHVGRGLH